MQQQPHELGRELRRLRLAAGLTLEQLAAVVHYSKGQLSKVERGIKTPSRELGRLCDAALGTNGELSALLPKQPPVKSEVAASPEEEVWSMQLSPEGSSWFRPVGRREVVAAGVGSALGLSLGMSRSPTSGEAAAVLEASAAMFAHYRSLGQSVGPALLLPTLIAQTHTLRELAASAEPRTRQGLLRLGSRYAEYIGWLVQETGNEEAALWWTQRAVSMAEGGGDHDLAAYALVRRALVTLYREDAEQTVALAQQAQSSGLPSRIRGLAAQREAQGHAIAGDYDASMRCLDRAGSLLARETPAESGPLLGTTHLPDPVAMIRGWCLHDLGRSGAAARTMDEQLDQVSPLALRTQARYGVRRALAHATAGEIDHACALTRALLAALTTVDSATITADLHKLARVLTRHSRNASVRELMPDLGMSLHLGTPSRGPSHD